MFHQRMIKSVVMWLHILVVSLLMCVMSHCSGVVTVRHTHINKDTTNICSHITTDLITH